MKCVSFDKTEAVEIVMLHSSSVQSVLNRKPITKGSLFKYLHSKKEPVTSDFTKQLLIEKILQYWKRCFFMCDDEVGEEQTNEPTRLPSSTNIQQLLPTNQQSSSDQTEQFPINQMARKFATWFYENLNTNRLQENDFWHNCKCSVQFLENKQCLMEEEYCGAAAVLEFCQSLLSKFSLYLNLNDTHLGTQGRIDCHGLVLVLTCGTLHKVNEFVGTFESVFGLSRDPFSQNNWKMNRINLRLHNFSQPSLADGPPTLLQSESIVPYLSLAISNDENEWIKMWLFWSKIN